MTGPKKQFALVILASLPAVSVLASSSSSSSSSFRCRSLLTYNDGRLKHLPRLVTAATTAENAVRKPWNIFLRGGATDTTNTTSTTTDTTTDTTTNNTTNTDDHLTFHASRPGDGSESDPDGIPTRFLRMQKNHRPRALAAFAATKKWRALHSVDTLLSRPRPSFDLCRAVFPVYIPGRDVAGNLVIVQRPGRFDVEVMNRNGLTKEDVLEHYIYVVEYCWNILDPGPPDRTMTVILDLVDVRWATFRDTEKRGFMLKFVRTMSDNYPNRSFKTLVINAPTWFDVVYKIVKPLLRESTRAKIRIVKKGVEMDRSLVELLGIGSVPREIMYDETYGEDDRGDSKVVGKAEPGMNSSIEQELRLFCLKRIKKSNKTMDILV